MNDPVKGLPVEGYRPQNQEDIDLVNEGKQIEERVLRYIDRIEQRGASIDHRFLSIGKTDIQKGFMSVFRSVFQPSRVAMLPEDSQ